MRSYFKLWISAGLGLWLSATGSRGIAAEANPCTGILESGGTLNVLTLNLLFAEYPQRAQRLDDIAAFLAGQKVHLVALQEVVGGPLDEFLAATLGGVTVEGNTAQELQRILKTRYGVDYALRSGFATGVRGVFNTANAILSRCPFVGTKRLKKLPKVSATRIFGIKIQLGQSVLMSRIAVPGLGEIGVFNAHLCSECTASNRLQQAKTAVSFIKQLQASRPSAEVLLLGDFNINVPALVEPLPPEAATFYRVVVRKNQFSDSFATFAAASAAMHFCDALAEHGCTRGVSDIVDPINPGADKQRIDYIFGKGALEVRNSRVVFNPLAIDAPHPPGVSDHSAVFTQYGMPQSQ